VTIQDLGALDADLVATEPASGLFQPKWDGSQWVETALVYRGVVVASKADVDRITRQRIVDLGEEKAKTEKILAGSDTCPSGTPSLPPGGYPAGRRRFYRYQRLT
jgi:hypothetical protein